MKKLILLLFITLGLACIDSNDNDVPDICVDETLISLETPCLTVEEPVCGCDGNTYSNSCVAFNYYGIIEYEEGICPGDCKSFDCD